MGLFDIFTGAPARRAAEENTQRLNDLGVTGNSYYDSGLTNALGSLDAGGKSLESIYGNLSAPTGQYLSDLGGPYSPSPGLQYATDAAVDANDRRMASRGMLNSGNTINQTGDIAGKLAYQDYNNWNDRRAALVNPTLTAAGGLANLGGQRAGLYSNDATNRVNLASNVTNGVNGQNTQAANAQMQGSANLLNFGMGLASLGAGGAGGGLGGLFGGFGGTPDYGQTTNMNIGSYSMPRFGR